MAFPPFVHMAELKLSRNLSFPVSEDGLQKGHSHTHFSRWNCSESGFPRYGYAVLSDATAPPIEIHLQYDIFMSTAWKQKPKAIKRKLSSFSRRSVPQSHRASRKLNLSRLGDSLFGPLSGGRRYGWRGRFLRSLHKTVAFWAECDLWEIFMHDIIIFVFRFDGSDSSGCQVSGPDSITSRTFFGRFCWSNLYIIHLFAVTALEVVEYIDSIGGSPRVSANTTGWLFSVS